MRRIPTATVYLSLLVLTGCQFSMRAGSSSLSGNTGPEPNRAPRDSAEVGHEPGTEVKSDAVAVIKTDHESDSDTVQQVAHRGWRPTSEVTRVVHVGNDVSVSRTEAAGTSETTESDSYPLNLTTALQLAGGNNLQIALADERIHEAVAKVSAAEVLWLPSLNAGAGFNSHTGKIQATNGDIVEVDRQSVFVGGGPVLGAGPLTGGAGGPMRLMANLSPVDAWFEPLAARQSSAAAEADQSAVYNDTLYQVTLAWLNLQSAQSQLAIANEAIENAEKLAGLTDRFAQAGAGLEADSLRAQAGLAERQRERLAAEEQQGVASAELARLLRLPVETPLYAVGAQPVPLEIIDADLSLSDLIGQGVTHRPELHRQLARMEAARQRSRQEQLRPWLPKLQAGVSGGGFAGGPNSEFGNLQDRVDIDALAIWELRNLGFGNAATIAERESQHRQASLTLESFQDQVAAEVVQAHARVQHRRAMIDAATAQVKAAQAALPLNFAGIEGHVLRPIEAQQAINNLATARLGYLRAIITYNEAQFALLRSVGEPPQSMSSDE